MKRHYRVKSKEQLEKLFSNKERYIIEDERIYMNEGLNPLYVETHKSGSFSREFGESFESSMWKYCGEILDEDSTWNWLEEWVEEVSI